MTYLLYASGSTKSDLQTRVAIEWDVMRRAAANGYHAKDRDAVLAALGKVLTVLDEPVKGERVALRLEGALDGKWRAGNIVSLRGLHCRIDLSYVK